MASDDKQAAQLTLRHASLACPVGVYEHYKGGQYIVFAHTVDEATLQALVHYFCCARGTRWTRTVANFMEPVDGTPRFRHVRTASLGEWRMATGEQLYTEAGDG